jgi:transposase
MGQALTVVADKGYDSRQDIEKCVQNGIIPHVALKYDKEERIYSLDYQEEAISEEERQSTQPETIQKCLAAGVLPVCYEGKGITVELQDEARLSWFIRQDADTVLCPMGFQLKRIKQKGTNTIYANKAACHQCANRCTASRQNKTVSFAADTQIVQVRLYGQGRGPATTMPEGMAANPYNHTLDRRDKPKRKVQLRIRSDTALIKARMCLSEHPFGTVKWHHDARYVLCKGKAKASAELGLSFLVYNMKRALNLVGPGKLIAAMAE